MLHALRRVNPQQSNDQGETESISCQACGKAEGKLDGGGADGLQAAASKNKFECEGKQARDSDSNIGRASFGRRLCRGSASCWRGTRNDEMVRGRS